MADLESLLIEQELQKGKFYNQVKNPKQLKKMREHTEDKKILTAEENADAFKLIKMINKIVNICMKELNVEFIPDEEKTPLVQPDITVEHPYITYRVKSREPKQGDGFKPRIRQHINDEERVGIIYGQKFQVILQFDIFASVYDEAEEVMRRFEELMLTYTGHFKEKGVAEFFLWKQLEDDKLDIYRQHMSVRSIQYYVEIEALTAIFHNKIEEINFLDL